MQNPLTIRASAKPTEGKRWLVELTCNGKPKCQLPMTFKDRGAARIAATALLNTLDSRLSQLFADSVPPPELIAMLEAR